MDLTRKLYPIRFENFKVPGEEMITKKDWHKHYPAEDGKLTNWALRSLLFEKGGRRCLIDAGFGNMPTEDFLSGFFLNGGFSFEKQLSELHLVAEDIDDVILTHLHFDHCGGCLTRKADTVVPTFPNATLWISQQQWESANNPGEKEVDSFHPETIALLKDHYKINFVPEAGGYMPGVMFHLVHGHTSGQIIPIIRMKERTFVFGADLFPSSAHLDPTVNMAYDVIPELAVCEKENFLNQMVDNQYHVIFQHGLYIEACSLKRQKDSVVIDKTFKIQDLF